MTTIDTNLEIQALERHQRALDITWADGHKSQFSNVWLRHSCRCSDCGDPLSATKRFDIVDIPTDIRASAAAANGPNLDIVWANDGHTSTYCTAWLRANCNCPESRARRRHRPTLWDASIGDGLPTISFSELKSTDTGLLTTLERVRDLGFALVHNVPLKVGALEGIAKLFGYIRETNYGRVYDLKVEPDARLLANRGVFIPPHTDEAFRHHTQGLALFHCLKAANDDGGSTILVDGFKVAEDLRNAYPEAFQFLSRVPQQFAHSYEGVDLRSEARLISCDMDGNIVGIRFNTLGALPPDLPQELIEPFYEALCKLVLLHRERANWLQIRLEPGNLLIVDNERVLHGRMPFDPSAGRRHLRLCYVDRDGFHSNLRILSRKLGRRSADLLLAVGAAN